MKLKSATVLTADGVRRPLGDLVRDGIHAVVERVPLTDEMKKKIKGCGGCNQRRLAMNRAEKMVKDFLSPKAPETNIPPP